MEHNPIWNDEEQMSFYQLLKKLPLSQQGPALLAQAEKLAYKATPRQDDLLKAIESMLNLWVLRYSDPQDEARANKIFSDIYRKMGVPEKAESFTKE